MSRSILFDEPYEIGSETELNCPITNDVLIYLGEKEGTLRFAPKNIFTYILLVIKIWCKFSLSIRVYFLLCSIKSAPNIYYM